MNYDQKTCPECKRHIANVPNPVLQRDVHGPLVKTYVLHAFYGCDTGCEGHIAYAEDKDENVCQSEFEVGCPSRVDYKEWAKEVCAAAFRGVPFSWDDCRVVV